MQRRIIRILIGVVVVLLIPALAMHLTDEVRWAPFDFLAAALLLTSAGLIFAHLSNQTDDVRHKTAIGVAVATVLVLVWAQLAVGIL
jgi:phosphatidylserine synthase